MWRTAFGTQFSPSTMWTQGWCAGHQSCMANAFPAEPLAGPLMPIPALQLIIHKVPRNLNGASKTQYKNNPAERLALVRVCYKITALLAQRLSSPRAMWKHPAQDPLYCFE